MNIGRLDTYAKARAEVISYTEQKAAKIDDGGAAPMDLEIFKGNKGGKGKGGKGKEKPRNPDKDVVCHLCKKKATAKALAGTSRRMAVLANLQSPRSPGLEPRVARARKEERAKVARAKERPTPLKVKEKKNKSGQKARAKTENRLAMETLAFCVCWGRVLTQHRAAAGRAASDLSTCLRPGLLDMVPTLEGCAR